MTTDDKQRLRERVWDDLEESGVARFPFPPHGRIPNVEGAATAAERLADQPEWREAETIKANPDAPQLPVRRRALREGKTVYMALPRLREEECFLELDPDAIAPDEYDAAPTVSNSSDYGVPVGPDEVGSIDLIVSGSVAVFEASGEATGHDHPTTGDRIGKGEGYSDLEYAILRELELVDDETPVATTVHERQVVDAADLGVKPTFGAHDVPMDLIVTPERVIRPQRAREKPAGIDWELLDEERLEEIPVLKTFEGSRRVLE